MLQVMDVKNTFLVSCLGKTGSCLLCENYLELVGINVMLSSSVRRCILLYVVLVMSYSFCCARINVNCYDQM